ncbi:MAG: hypothetical protein J6C55_02900, partial [Oscillospiraceae bacterium]|nr:hypothetical protein [Oscillospiraceae bacterium]
MKRKIKIVLVLSLCLGLLLSFTGCGNDGSDWVASYKDQKVSVGVYIRYLIDEYNNLYIKDLTGELKDPEEVKAKEEKSSETDDKNKKNKIGSSEDQTITKTINTKDKKISILKKIIDKKTGEQWMIDEAKEKVLTDILVNNKFKDMNLKLDEEKSSFLERNLTNQWDALNEQENFEKKGVSKESVLETLLTQLKKKEIFNAYYGEGGEKEVTEDQIKSYLRDNYNKVKYFSFELHGLSEEEKETKTELYKEFLSRAQAGENIDDLIKEFDKKEYNEEEEEENEIDESEDNMSSENERYDVESSSSEESGYDHETDEEDDTVSIFKKEKASGEFSSDVAEAIEKASLNQVTGVEGKDELVVFIKQDPSDSPKYIEENKETLISEMKDEEFEEEMKNWVDKSEIR